MNEKRKNNCVYQKFFDADKMKNRSSPLSQPELVWLNRLEYLLGASHQQLLEAVKHADAMPDVQLYDYVFNTYDLQIWMAGNSREFFQSDAFIDFEGDTNSFLAIDKERQLCHLVTEDRIHVWLPVSPKIAIVFCSPARCWHSPPELQIK